MTEVIIEDGDDPYPDTEDGRVARIYDLLRDARRVGRELERYSREAWNITESLTNVCEDHMERTGLLSEDRLDFLSDLMNHQIHRWKQELTSVELCADLRLSPTSVVTKVEIRESLDGCLQRIGDSMVDGTNNNIKELIMVVDALLREDEDLDNAASFIQFIQTSPSLVKVTLEFPTETPVPKYINQLGGLLFDAIASNPSIQELQVVHRFPPRAFQKLLSTTQSIRILHFNCTDLSHRPAKDQKVILNAFATNDSIEKVSLHVDDDDEEFSMVNKILGQTGYHDKLDKLSLWRCQPPAEEFYMVLSSTQSLETLEFDGNGWTNYTTQQQSRILDAFATNRSILNLQLSSSTYDWPIIHNILRQLHLGPTTLQKLVIHECYSDYAALKDYLCHADTKLPYLELEKCRLDMDSMDGILEGILQQRHGVVVQQNVDGPPPSMTTAMTQLTLKSCELTADAMDRVVAFVAQQTRRLNQHNVTTMTTRTTSPMFLYEPANGDIEYNGTPEYVDCRYVIGHLIVVSLSTIVSSTSSSLEASQQQQHHVSLSLYPSPSGNVPGFSNALATTAPHMGLVCLQLYRLSLDDSVNLARCLPKILSLRVLHLVDIQPNAVDSTKIWNAMRQNGSVFTSSFRMEDKTPLFDDDLNNVNIPAYGQRNRVFTNMIIQKTVLGSVLPAGTRSVDNGRKKHKLDSTLVLVPSLFQVAKSIPLVRSRLILSTLLALDLSIGEQQ